MRDVSVHPYLVGARRFVARLSAPGIIPPSPMVDVSIGRGQENLS
jgi:hypothetical protein